jgi:hypothetical protein
MTGVGAEAGWAGVRGSGASTTDGRGASMGVGSSMRLGGIGGGAAISAFAGAGDASSCKRLTVARSSVPFGGKPSHF